MKALDNQALFATSANNNCKAVIFTSFQKKPNCPLKAT